MCVEWFLKLASYAGEIYSNCVFNRTLLNFMQTRISSSMGLIVKSFRVTAHYRDLNLCVSQLDVPDLKIRKR